jgi:ribosomal protein L11 methyltransferase
MPPTTGDAGIAPLEGTAGRRFDIVVANILTNPLLRAGAAAGRARRPGRAHRAAGVLAAQAEQVIAAYAPLIALHVGAERDGWVRLEGQRC